MSEAPRILLVEDDEDDYLITRDMLRETWGDALRLDWAATIEAASDQMRRNSHDIHLIDYRIGAHNGLDLVVEMRSAGFPVPMILLTGQDSREIDLRAMKAGASDYLVKDQISAPLLDRAIRYAIERKRIERQLATMAQYDPLTGLVNRSCFQDRLAESIAQAKRSNMVTAVLLIDLDHFKEINDTLGHHVGDALLTQVAERLRESMRETDTVARLGGDEFAVICTNLNQATGSTTCAQKILKSLAGPFHVEGNELMITASIGISHYPADSTSAEQLLRNADLALYKVKAEGRAGFQHFDTDLNARMHARQLLEGEMRRALEREEFRLFFQPKIGAASGALIGAEALLRWEHPERGLVTPDVFIPIAEASGLILDMGDWVLRTACQRMRQWSDKYRLDIPVSVNISRVQFRRLDLVDTVMNAIHAADIDPGALDLEITETVIMDKYDVATELLYCLRREGVQLSIDDFGTGQSSLSALKRFPVNRLKIDRSFIRNVMDDPKDTAIAKTIIALGQNLNMAVTAEGVEDARQLEFLKSAGCDEIQGFYYARPMPEDRFIDWCRSRGGARPRPRAAAAAP